MKRINEKRKKEMVNPTKSDRHTETERRRRGHANIKLNDCSFIQGNRVRAPIEILNIVAV